MWLWGNWDKERLQNRWDEKRTIKSKNKKNSPHHPPCQGTQSQDQQQEQTPQRQTKSPLENNSSQKSMPKQNSSSNKTENLISDPSPNEPENTVNNNLGKEEKNKPSKSENAINSQKTTNSSNSETAKQEVKLQILELIKKNPNFHLTSKLIKDKSSWQEYLNCLDSKEKIDNFVKKIQQEIVGNNQTANKPPSNNKNLTKTLAVLGIVAVGIIFASWIVAKKRKLKNK